METFEAGSSSLTMNVELINDPDSIEEHLSIKNIPIKVKLKICCVFSPILLTLFVKNFFLIKFKYIYYNSDNKKFA